MKETRRDCIHVNLVDEQFPSDIHHLDAACIQLLFSFIQFPRVFHQLAQSTRSSESCGRSLIHRTTLEILLRNCNRLSTKSQNSEIYVKCQVSSDLKFGPNHHQSYLFFCSSQSCDCFATVCRKVCRII